jgi:hypothetical protein
MPQCGPHARASIPVGSFHRGCSCCKPRHMNTCWFPSGWGAHCMQVPRYGQDCSTSMDQNGSGGAVRDPLAINDTASCPTAATLQRCRSHLAHASACGSALNFWAPKSCASAETSAATWTRNANTAAHPLDDNAQLKVHPCPVPPFAEARAPTRLHIRFRKGARWRLAPKRPRIPAHCQQLRRDLCLRHGQRCRPSYS